jgi:AhpD family alkylhydroperoxidase
MFMKDNRIDIEKVAPYVYKTMFAFGEHIQKGSGGSINLKQKQLIKMRASQINGCAYCLDMHTVEALKIGETEQRIFTLSAWRDTPFFSEEERAILALTEEVTLISQRGVSEKTYEAATKVLDEAQIAEVIMHIIHINAWNRIAVSTKMQPALAVATEAGA